MKPFPFAKPEEEAKKAPVTASTVVSPEKNETATAEPEPKPTVLVTELDAYVAERNRTQPATLDDVRAIGAEITTREHHRLVLPEYFESYSYDCTRGLGCTHHAWKQFEVRFADGIRLPQWDYERRGEFVFKWGWKTKRSIDDYLNRGWLLVNRRYFPESPRHLFTANGGIEEGDMILYFMPVKAALALRAAPGERSTALLRSRLTPGERPGQVIMTGDVGNTNYYGPDLSAESSEEGSSDFAPGGSTFVVKQ